MAEIVIPEDYPHKEGYVLDLRDVFLDLYRLLTIFGSSKTLSNMTDLHGGDPVSELMESEISEIKRIIINSAVTARIIDEREDFIIPKNKYCGKLITDISDKTSETELNLRQACNKIIHAVKIRTDVEKEKEKPFLQPILYFYGRYGNKEWKATINIYDFIQLYYSVFKSA